MRCFMSQDEKMDSDIEAFKEISERLEEERKAKIRAQFFETEEYLIRLSSINCVVKCGEFDDASYSVWLNDDSVIHLNDEDGERLKRVLLGEDE